MHSAIDNYLTNKTDTVGDRKRDLSYENAETELYEAIRKRYCELRSVINPDCHTPETRKRFDVALSFPGEHREFVKKVADILATILGSERVFYDANYQAELARPNLDTYLQEIYHDKAELVVVFLCAEYEKKEWCGLEWRAVLDMLKQKKTAEIMPVRFDDTNTPGLLSIDGYIDAKGKGCDPAKVADMIVQRLRSNRQAT